VTPEFVKLNHINLAVPDVAATRAFFEKFFGFRCDENKGQDVLSVLRDEAGFVLILSNFDKKITPAYPRDFHLGFIYNKVEEVNELYERMKVAGIGLRAPKTAHGSWGFYVDAPGGITIEVSAYPDSANT
jgi:catechol 2,3-dioxygenase-like lactoylglutathione lyase family enzyme